MKSPMHFNLILKIVCCLLLTGTVFIQACSDDDGSPDESSETFKVVGRNLTDPCGSTVLLKGVNKMSVFDEQDVYGTTYFPEIAKTNSNCVRIVWRKTYSNGSPTVLSQLDSLIKNCIKISQL